MRFRECGRTIVLAVICLCAVPVVVRAATDAAGDVSPDVRQALLALRTTKDDAGRQKAYATLAEKGDARLILPLKAYLDGRLQDRDGTLVIYGEKNQIPGKGNAFPLREAFSGKPLQNSDGSPVYVFADRIDLSAPGMMRLPPTKRVERATISDLLSTLSLLDPDPAARLESIHGVSERAVRALISDEDEAAITSAWAPLAARLKTVASSIATPDAAELKKNADALDEAIHLPLPPGAKLTSPLPSGAAVSKASAAIAGIQKLPVAKADSDLAQALTNAANATRNYSDRLDTQNKVLDELTKFGPVLKRQLDKDPTGPFATALREAVASTEVLLGTPDAQLAAARTLGKISTSRAANLLARVVEAARRTGNPALQRQAAESLASAQRYQTFIRAVQNTFAGLSLGSILVLLALGLSIIFGLMGVINMAHGEFMMIGAFTTYVVSEAFKHLPAGWYEYYPVAAVPAAFLVAGFVGLLCEVLVVRHLYGRPLETLLATWGIGLVLIQAVRIQFGDTLSVTPPHWMEGGLEVAPDLVLARNRIYIIAYCAICIAAVHLLVNRTKLGLMLRATTQNRQMAATLGVPTRRIDALTFALGAGLAGLAGVAVPLYDKINPGMGQDYVVDSFMVVVVGGVGKLAGVIWAGLSMGFLNKYLEPLLQTIKPFASSASVIGKVVVLALIVLFLQWRPSGLFPPKGRLADA